jgi:HAD superfamily hydrolase (TIGR01549 family)
VTRPESIFFDAGNTLVFLDCECITRLAAEYDVAVSPERLRAIDYRVRQAIDRSLLERVRNDGDIGHGTVSMGSQDLWLRYFGALLQAAGAPPESCGEIARRLRERDQADPRGLWHGVEEGAGQVLAELRRRGSRLGIVSNSDGRLQEKLEVVGLAPYFDVVVDSEVVGVEKPEPRIFEIGLEALGTTAERSLYVGDIFSVDVLGARRAGLQAALYDGGGLYDDWNCRTLRRLPDLIDLLEERGAA